MPAVGGRTSGKSLEQRSGVSRDVPDVSTALLLIVAIPGSCLAWHLWSSVRRVVECAAFLACMPMISASDAFSLRCAVCTSCRCCRYLRRRGYTANTGRPSRACRPERLGARCRCVCSVKSVRICHQDTTSIPVTESLSMIGQRPRQLYSATVDGRGPHYSAHKHAESALLHNFVLLR